MFWFLKQNWDWSQLMKSGPDHTASWRFSVPYSVYYTMTYIGMGNSLCHISDITYRATQYFLLCLQVVARGVLRGEMLPELLHWPVRGQGFPQTTVSTMSRQLCLLSRPRAQRLHLLSFHALLQPRPLQVRMQWKVSMGCSLSRWADVDPMLV